MTGPEHYREAERLIARIEDSVTPIDDRELEMSMAQVHATLALASAQVEDMESTELRPGWAEIVDGPAER